MDPGIKLFNTLPQILKSIQYTRSLFYYHNIFLLFYFIDEYLYQSSQHKYCKKFLSVFAYYFLFLCVPMFY